MISWISWRLLHLLQFFRLQQVQVLLLAVALGQLILVDRAEQLTFLGGGGSDGPMVTTWSPTRLKRKSAQQTLVNCFRAAMI